MVHFYSRFFLFLTGIVLGTILGKLYFRQTRPNISKTESSYETWFFTKNFKRRSLLWDSLRYSKSKYALESALLFNKIKISCIVLVQNRKNIEAVKDTWARGCHSLQFIENISTNNKSIAIKRTSENSSWVLLCKKIQSLPLNYDWFLIVRDNTFVILENLRYYVATFNSSDAYYLGHLVKFWSTLYNSGQAGYVLSKGAIRRLLSTLNDIGCNMNSYWNKEDFYLGKQLAELNITPSDTRDEEGFSTFHQYNLFQLFFPQDSHDQLSVLPQKCCSKYSITFKVADGDKMYQYYYLIYTLQVFSYGHLGNKLSSIGSYDEVWKIFLKEHGHFNYNISNEEYYQIWENLVHDPLSFASHMKKENHLDYDEQN